MRRQSSSDYLAHSFTDLMTSLMVIFILLLLVFVSNQAGANEAITQALLSDLKRELGNANNNTKFENDDKYTIVLTIPDEVMTFEPNRHELKPRGEDFLKAQVPRLAEVLCNKKYRGSIQSVIVEGHSDNTPYRGATAEESQAQNLKLSQDRSMEVVSKTLLSLQDRPMERGCFLEMLSATGRGEQDLQATADKSRRVMFKIRVNSGAGAELEKLFRGK